MKQIKIGSAENNNVVLAHPSVSPNHAEILVDDQGNYFVTDLNSHYGTFVNGFRIQGSVKIQINDIIKTGDITIPWQTYFAPAGAFQQTAPPPSYSNTSNAVPSMTLAPKKSNKKLFIILGAGVLVLLLIGALFLFLWTRPSDAHMKFIPKNSFLVFSADMKSLAGKLDMDKIRNSEIFEDMLKNMDRDNDALKDASTDPLSSGIDIFSQPYGFMTMNKEDYDLQYSFGIAFAIKNSDNFYKFIEKAVTDHSIEGTKDFHYIKTDSHMCIAWNDDGGVMLATDRSSSDMKDYARSLVEQKADESILSVESFDSFKKADYDIGAYLNYDGLKRMSFVSLPDWSKGGASVMKLNFENGKMTYTSEFIPGKASSVKMPQMMRDKGIKDDLKKSIPGNSMAIATMSIDMKELYTVLDNDPNSSELIDNLARSLNVQRGELPGIFGGDIYFSLADVKQQITSYEMPDYDSYDLYYGYNYKTTYDTTIAPVYVIGATVNNEDVFKSIMANFGRNMDVKDTADGVLVYTYGYYSKTSYYVAHHGDNYFFTNDFDYASKLGENGTTGKSISGTTDELISKNPVAIYANLNYSKYPDVLKDYMENQMSRREYRTLQPYLKMADRLEMSGNTSSQKMDIYFNEQKNALMIIFDAMNKAYVNMR